MGAPGKGPLAAVVGGGPTESRRRVIGAGGEWGRVEGSQGRVYSTLRFVRQAISKEEGVAFATTEDGVNLYYEEVGSGVPILFIHEFAGDLRSWEPQLWALSRT